MAQCKLRCGKAAVAGPWHKQYCREHGEAYLAKRREAAKNRALLPDCATGCGDKAQGRKQSDGSVVSLSHGLCQSCAMRATKEKEENLKSWQFEQAETIEELKDWIREHLT